MNTRLVLILCLLASFLVQAAAGGASNQTYARDTGEATEPDSLAEELGIAVGGTFPSTEAAPREQRLVLQSAWTENLGALRFETVEEWASHNPWFGTGGHHIEDTGGMAFTSDFAVGLNIRTHNTADETILSMPFYRPDGSLYDEGRMRYDLDTDTWYEWSGWPVPQWWPIRIGIPEDPVYRDFGWTQSMPILPSDPLGTWTINFLVNGSLTYSEQFELVQRPTMVQARMVKEPVDGELVLGLGVDLNLRFPPTDNLEQRRFVRLSGTVNEVPVAQDYDVTALVGAGEPAKDIGFNEGTDPSTDKRILDFAAASVPRFEQNETFELTAEIYASDGLFVVPSEPVTVEIYLPVVIVHGYLLPTGRELIGRPVADGVYSALENGLSDGSSGPFTTGYTTDDTWYRTLWRGHWGFSWSPYTLAHWLDGWISDALDATYADRVNIIGHSFGGLIGRYYVADPDWLVTDASSRVHKLVMIGTPNSGTSLFYTATSRDARADVIDWARREPITLWGLPRYVDSYGAPIACLYDSGTGAPVWPDPLVVRPPSSYTYPEHFPDVPPPPGVTYYSIYRSNIPTDYLLWATPTRDDWYRFRRKSKGAVMPQMGGDGLVPAPSAVLPGAISIPLVAPNPSSRRTRLSLGHGVLPANSDVQAAVLGALSDGE